MKGKGSPTPFDASNNLLSSDNWAYHATSPPPLPGPRSQPTISMTSIPSFHNRVFVLIFLSQARSMGGDNDHVIPAIVAGINHHAIACTSRRGSTLALGGVRFTQVVR